MKSEIMKVNPDRAGIDEASEAVQAWMSEAGVETGEAIRVRVTVEELLLRIYDHGEVHDQIKLVFSKRMNNCRLIIRYGGSPYDPAMDEPADDIREEWSEQILIQEGYLPAWRMRSGENELRLRIRRPDKSAQIMMACSFVMAVAVGLLSPVIPENIKKVIIDYFLNFLSEGFLDLLTTFIGPMIFFTVLTGICGIESAYNFGRVGKLMIKRYIGISFLICLLGTLATNLFFNQGYTAGKGGASAVMSIMELIFGIIPSDPVNPFLNGNTLQVVLMGIMIGVALLHTEQSKELNTIMTQIQNTLFQCIRFVAMLLPVYVASSLIIQFWTSGAGAFVTLVKPLALSVVFGLIIMAVYLAIVSRKLQVKPSVLLAKLLPDFLIGLTTASSSIALALSMEINEEKLGMDSSFSRVATPIGCMLFAGSYSMTYILTGAYLGEYYNVQYGLVWWIYLLLISFLLGLATPPVSGSTISCLMILVGQLGIPKAGLSAGITLMILLDFICTAVRIAVQHMEMILQADRLGLLDREILRNK